MGVCNISGTITVKSDSAIIYSDETGETKPFADMLRTHWFVDSEDTPKPRRFKMTIEIEDIEQDSQSTAEQLTMSDFTVSNFWVWTAEINGGFYNGGTSIIINLQNSNKLFIYCGDRRDEWPISSFDEGLKLANENL